MKKTNTRFYTVVGLLLMLISPTILWGQTDVETPHPKHVGIGVKAGASFSRLVLGFPVQSMKGNITPSYGLIFSYVDTKIVGLQVEINYKSKSWEEIPSATNTFSSQLDYLEIPMLTTIHFGKKLKFFVNFGPYLAILLKQSQTTNVSTTSDAYQYYENRSPRKGDFGLTGGGGIRFHSKIGMFQLEARYTFGFQDIYDPKTSSIDFANMETMGVHFSYQLPLVNEK